MNSDKFKILSEAPAATIISASMIDRRMDAGCFQPMYLKNENNLLNGGVPAARLGTLYSKGNYGSLPDSVDYATTGVALIRGTDLQSMAVNLSDTVRVPDHYYDQFKKAQINSGDILMLVKGASIDRPDSVAIFPKTDDKAIANGSVFIIRANAKKVNSKYLLAVMTSESFLLQKRRGSSNTGALYNDLDTIKAFIVPLPDPKIQEYIGQKVELAEKCCEEAKIAHKQVMDLLIFPFGTLSSMNGYCTNLINPCDISSRLDAKYYRPEYLKVVDAVNSLYSKTQKLNDYVKEISNGIEIRKYTNVGVAYLTVSDIKNGLLKKDTAPQISNLITISSRGKIRAGDVLVVRTGSIGQAAVVTDDTSDAVISSHFIRLRLKNPDDGQWLSFYLNSTIGKMLQQRISYGAVQPQIGQDELLNLPVPGYSSEQIQKSTRLIIKNELLMNKSDFYVYEAKSDVESLIEGKLDTDAILSGKLKAPTWEDIEKELGGI